MSDGWAADENLALGDTEELIRDIDRELGGPTGAKKQDWDRRGPVDLSEHTRELRLATYKGALCASAAFMPPAFCVDDPDSVRTFRG